MPSSYNVSEYQNVQDDNTTRYENCYSGRCGLWSTESSIDYPIPFSANFQGLNVSALNNQIQSAWTVDFRVNGVTSALTVSVPVGSTGNYRNVSDNVTVIKGDKINYRTAVPTSFTDDAVFGSIGVIMTNAGLVPISINGNMESTNSDALLDNGYEICPIGWGKYNNTTNNWKWWGKGYTTKFLWGKVTSNAHTSDVTYTFQVANVDTSLTFLVPASTSGNYRTTTETASFAAGDGVRNKLIETAAGTGTLAFTNSGICIVGDADGIGSYLSGSTTNQFFYSGSVANVDSSILSQPLDTGSALETNNMGCDMTVKGIDVNYDSVNTMDIAMTTSIVIDGVIQTNLVASIPALTTGHFGDSTGTESIVIGELAGWNKHADAGGTGSTWIRGDRRVNALQYQITALLFPVTVVEDELTVSETLVVSPNLKTRTKPDNDDTIGTWFDEAAGTTNIYLSIDEDEWNINDADFIQSVDIPTSDYICGLATPSPIPTTDTDHILSIRYQKEGGTTAGKQCDLTVELRQGTTVIATATYVDIGPLVTQRIIITPAEAANITDYTNLNVRINGLNIGGGGGRWVEVMWVNLQTPNPPNPTYTIDTVFFKKDRQVPYTNDSVFEKLDIQKTYLIDSVFANPIEKDYFIDTVFFKLDRDVTYSIDSVFEKLNIPKTYLLDSAFANLVEKEYFIDSTFANLVEKSYTLTVGFDQLYGISYTEPDETNLHTGMTGNSTHRTASGDLYTVLRHRETGPNISQIVTWKSTDEGKTWTEQDVVNRPEWTRALPGEPIVSSVMDSNEVLHIFYTIQLTGAMNTSEERHVVFATATDLWGTDELVANFVTEDTGGTADGIQHKVTIDANDDLHLAYPSEPSDMGAHVKKINYVNNIGGSWSTPLQVGPFGSYGATITLSKDSGGTVVPIITTSELGDFHAYLGNVLNATSFTDFEVDTATNFLYNNAATSLDFDFFHVIAVDQTNNDLVYWVHDNTNSWSTGWTKTVIDSTADYFVSGTGTSIIVVGDDDIHVSASQSSSVQGQYLWSKLGAGAWSKDTVAFPRTIDKLPLAAPIWANSCIRDSNNPYNITAATVVEYMFKNGTNDIIYTVKNVAGSVEKTYQIDSVFSITDIPKTYLIDSTFANLVPKTYLIDSVFSKIDIPKEYTIDSVFELLENPKTYLIDSVFFKLDKDKTYLIDSVFNDLAIPKGYAIDSVFEKLVIPKAYSIDSVFQLINPKTYLIDSVFSLINPKTYLIDSVFHKLDRQVTYQIDSVFEKLDIPKTYTIDSVFEKLDIPKAYTIDSVFSLINPKTYTIDSVFEKLDIPKAYTIDSVFFKLDRQVTYLIDSVFNDLNIPKGYSIDSVFEKLVIPKTYTIDSVFALINPKTYLIDSVFQLINPKTYSIDSVFFKLDRQVTYTIDSVFEKLDIPKTYSIDSVFEKLIIPKTYTIDSVFQLINPKTYSIDSVFSLINPKTYSIDSVFELLENPKTYQLDSVFQLINQPGYSIDSVFEKLDIPKTYLLDTVFGFPDKEKAYTIDSVFQLINPKTYSIDSVFEKLNIPKTYLLDSVFSLINPKTYSIDSVFFKLDRQVTYSIDSVFEKLDIPKTYLIDSIFVNPIEKEYFIDSVFQLINPKGYSIDSVFSLADIPKTYLLDTVFGFPDKDKTYLIDSVFFKLDKDKTYLLDSVFGEVGIQSKPYNIDSVFFKLGREVTYSIDSVFNDLNIPKGYSIDSVFALINPKTYLLDSVFELLENPNGYSIDSVFEKLINPKTYLIDSTFANLVSKPYSLDSVFANIVDKTYSLDTVFFKARRLSEITVFTPSIAITTVSITSNESETIYLNGIEEITVIG